MEWKEKIIEKFIEIILVAIAGVIGAKFVSGWKRFINPIKKLIINIEKYDDHENRITITKNFRMADFNLDPVPKYIFDAFGNMIYANTAFLILLGFDTMDQVKGVGFIDAVIENEKDEVEEKVDLLVKHPSNSCRKITFKNLKTGKIIKTICYSEPIFDDKNNLYGRLGFVKIIS